jgi:uncharacterized membrane protein
MTLAQHQEPFRAGDKPYPHQRPSYQYVWLLMVLMGIGLILRLTLIDGKSLWQDELYTLASATGNNLFEATVGEAIEGSGESVRLSERLPDNLPENLKDPSTPKPTSFFTQPISKIQPLQSFWQALSRNIQMPAYPLLARGLISLFGPDPVMLRLVSAIFGVLLIPASFWLGQLLLYNTPERRAHFGLVLASLVTVCGFQVTYSQTARVYALVTLTAVVATCFLISLLQHYSSDKTKEKPVKTNPFKDAWPYWLGFTLFSVLGLYTTYLYTFLLGFHILYVIVLARPHKGFYLPMACCGLILGGIYLPWLPMYQAQQEFLKEIGHGNLTGLWNPISLIERLWNVLAEQITPKDLFGKLWSTVLIALGLIQGWRLKEARPIVGLALLWLLAIIGGLLWIDLSHQTHRILSKRYTMLASPSLYLLMATGLYFLPPRWWGLPPQFSGNIIQKYIFPVLFGLTLGILSLNSLAVVSGEKFVSKENYMGAAQWINSQNQKHDLVLVNHSGVHTAAMSFYLDQDLQVGGISRKTKETPWQPDALDQTLAQLTQGHPRIWLVFTHSYGPVKTSIRDWLSAHDYQSTSSERFSGVDASLWVHDKRIHRQET